jgi:hypothetical protein
VLPVKIQQLVNPATLEQYFLQMEIAMCVLVQAIVFNVMEPTTVKNALLVMFQLMEIALFVNILVMHVYQQLHVLLAYHLNTELSILQLLNVFAIVAISTTTTPDNVFRAFQSIRIA